ncbi:hypothetical protein B0W48_16655 [Pseudoalteromonas aliena]|uniref:Antitoxin n=1 Tax=Pseudoalteromonas aliena TaxID=247523 RepID=A0A1Q2H1M9_9GAMM|nr:hypothetical protein [Pseudoalteromonas aliena]AQQ01255.1 hypothetical protein B0W48_16655 [Pseudoalteromonas aliena]
MSIEYKEVEVSNSKSILDFVENLESQERELILSSNERNVGAILTAEQYEWFLDQLDAQQNFDEISERASDLDGSQSLADLKKEFDQ